MSLSSNKNISIKGISACVPSNTVENNNYEFFEPGEYEKFVASVGIERRRIVKNGICTSDLCFAAAEQLIKDLGWQTEEIEVLVFVSHTADYKLPATSCILQDRLGIPSKCMTLDISLGCSGYIHGLKVIASLLSENGMKKGLLLAGNTQSSYASYEDKSVYPLFADAGTATAVEYKEGSGEMFFEFGTDGSGFKSIIVPDGGCRNPVNSDSFRIEDFGNGIKRSRLHEALDGMEVFSFGILRAPQSINELLKSFCIPPNKIDYYLFHQANKFMVERIRKKLNIPPEKVPYNISDFGNTSCATIPLLMVTNLRKELMVKELNLVMCGFGVGLSWGSAAIVTNKIACPELIEI
jgi:3-oxoacyl-[acyl-carrier-protein] synthase III